MRRRLSEQVAKELTLDWKNPRIICIAESFNRFDIDTVEIIPIRIELMTYRLYEGGIFSLNFESSLGGQEQISVVQPSKQGGSDSDNKNRNSVDMLRARASNEIKAVFDDARARVIALGPQVVERVTSAYVAYRVSKNFVEFNIQKSQLKIYLRPMDYNDP
jgi:hypothetical protein